MHLFGNSRELQSRTHKLQQTIGKSREQRRRLFYYRRVGIWKAVIDQKSTAVNWELKA